MAILCVDIGGTKINVGIMDSQLRFLEKHRYETERENLMPQLEQIIANTLANTSTTIAAIGISTAGRVDFQTGQILYATEVLPGWTGTPVKNRLEQLFSLPVVVDNDGNCAAYAEYSVGAVKEADHIICMTLGTGVGGGIIANQTLMRGSNGAAGEIGHMLFERGGIACSCGKKGCWEQYVSGTALQRKLKEEDALAKTIDSLAQLFAASQQNPAAKDIVSTFINDLALGLSSLTDIIDPDMIVIGGGMIHSSNYWWDELLASYSGNAILKQATLGNDAGMIGAAILAQEMLQQL